MEGYIGASDMGPGPSVREDGIGSTWLWKEKGIYDSDRSLR